MKPGTDDDDSLFRAAMRDVRQLTPSPRVPVPAAGRRPQPPARRPDSGTDAPTMADLRLDASILAGDELRYARPGVAASTLRKLRRGQLPIQAQLDLHGATAQQARLILHGFLQEALARNAQCVHIIHGKGLRAGRTGPVLKQTVDAFLRAQAPVVAFTSAAQDGGGTGAVYVLLKSA